MANKLLGLIRRAYVYLDKPKVKTLYTSLARTHLKYRNTTWCPVFKNDCELLENSQRRAKQLAPALRDLSYVEKITALDLPSL